MSPPTDRKYGGQTSLSYKIDDPSAKAFSEVFEHVDKLLTTGTPGNRIVAIEYMGNTLKVEIQTRNDS